MSQQIPKLIIQTNERSDVPETMRLAMTKIRQDNPEYEYNYYNHEDRREFLINHFDSCVIEAYDKLIPGAYKSDLFRYCVLYKRGGVYLDTSFVSLKPMSEILKGDETFVVMKKDEDTDIYNAFMASVPGHMYLKEVILEVVNCVDRQYYGQNELCPTGPTLLARVWSQYCQAHLAELKVLSWRNNYLWLDSERIFQVKYPNYYQDMIKYTQQEHYSQLWLKRGIYRG